MWRMIILGAGASHACPNTHPDLPLPLLADLPQIIRTDLLNPDSGWPRIGKAFHRLLKSSENDIEALFTTLFQLEEYFFKPAKTAGLECEFIDRILASGALSEFLPNADDCKLARQVLDTLRAFRQEADGSSDSLGPSASYGPRNVLTLFRAALMSYIEASVQRHPCPLHVRLFEMLELRDCVVSFNYDEIADYALYSLGKLLEQSFEGLGFTTINLPSGTPQSGFFARFFKVHGSVNWWNHCSGGMPNSDYWSEREGLRPSIRGGPEVHYYLGHRKLLPNAGNTPDAFLLPFHCKDLIYRSVPMFTRHMHAFRYWLADAKEIWLVGKNFKNADRELNGLIRWATSGRERLLHIIDPCIDVEFHLSLFNAKLGNGYSTLEEYARDA